MNINTAISERSLGAKAFEGVAATVAFFFGSSAVAMTMSWIDVAQRTGVGGSYRRHNAGNGDFGLIEFLFTLGYIVTVIVMGHRLKTLRPWSRIFTSFVAGVATAGAFLGLVQLVPSDILPSSTPFVVIVILLGSPSVILTWIAFRLALSRKR